jgi:hypothetical protein
MCIQTEISQGWDVFIHMVKQSYQASHIPRPEQIRTIFGYPLEQAEISKDERAWY